MSDKEEDFFIPAEQNFEPADSPLTDEPETDESTLEDITSDDSSKDEDTTAALNDINDIFLNEDPEIILDYTNREELIRDIKVQEDYLKTQTPSELRDSLFAEHSQHRHHKKSSPAGYGENSSYNPEPTVNPNAGRLTAGKAGGWIFAWVLLGGIFVGTSISQHNDAEYRKSWDELMADMNTDPESSIDTHFAYVMDETTATPSNTIPSEDTNQKPDLTYSNYYYSMGDSSDLTFDIEETTLEIGSEEGRYLLVDYYDFDGGRGAEIISEAFTTIQGSVNTDYPYDVVFDVSDSGNSETTDALDELGVKYAIEPTPSSYNWSVVVPIEEVLGKDFS